VKAPLDQSALFTPEPWLAPNPAIEIAVYGDPQPQGSKRFVGFKGRPGRGVIIEANPKTKPWRGNVADEARKVMGDRPPLTGPIRCDVSFWVRRPVGHFRRDGRLLPSAPAWPAVRPDRGKLLRAVEDALSGIVWRDDAQCVAGEPIKRYATSRPNGHGPGVDIRVEELAP